MNNSNTSFDYDVCVIGGGINGTGIARDAAGRGLRVLLLEAKDLASATSSKSTKLIHGGLRYLEHYEFGLVRESLGERETLLNAAPHIIWPMEFILPHAPHLRPQWMIRAGLFLYDKLSKRNILPASKKVKLNTPKHILKPQFKTGFSYADCWVEDARLVVLNAMDARDNGADIRTRTPCTNIQSKDGGGWDVTFQERNKTSDIKTAKMVVNAAGPWVREILDRDKLAQNDTPFVRMSKGSHIIVNKLYDGGHSYILQQDDNRIIFTIPYEKNYTLIGTTDVEYTGSPYDAEISAQEVAYLCNAVNQNFEVVLTSDDVISHYSGVRPLLDDGQENASKVTRDYKLILSVHGANKNSKLLNVFGGKLTTYRVLSEEATDIVTHTLNTPLNKWTKMAKLPGGNILTKDFNEFVNLKLKQYSALESEYVFRLARAYGTHIDAVLNNVGSAGDLGAHHGATLYDAEVKYLIQNEWAKAADDVLWRRSKLGLHMSNAEIVNFESTFDQLYKRYGITP